MRGIIRFFAAVAVALAVSVAVLEMIPGWKLIERVKYEWSGAGVESWEQEALEAGISSEVEEYYYEHLPEELQEAYRELYVHIMKNEDSGTMYADITVENFWKAYYAVLADHPEIFWIGSSAQIEESGLTGRVVSYQLQSIVPVESRAEMQEQLEATADECIYGISADADTYEKIKHVYEYIIDIADYSADGEANQSIQSVLLYHKSVCAGYSRAFQYILNRMGVFCTYITGKIENGGDHGWNMVRIGENYYYVDVTWGDPVFANQVDGSEDTVKNYNYLCCTETDLFKTHIPDGSVWLPSCTSDDYNYYKLNNMYYESFDYDTIYGKLMESVWNGDSEIIMKFGTQEDYEQAKYELFQNGMLQDAGQYLMNLNGVSSWNYRYHTEDDFYLITLYWK
jgi:hypothetical protein